MSLIGSITSMNPLGGLGQAQELGPLQNGAGGIPGGLGQIKDLAGTLQALSQGAPGAAGKTGELAGLLQAGASEGLSSGSAAGAAGLIPGAGGGVDFGSLLDHAVQEVNGKMNVADAQEAKMLTGESTNLHQTMISVQEAGVALSLMVEVRNKLVESYQQLMQMQV